jgi:hypothetical protein
MSLGNTLVLDLNRNNPRFTEAQLKFVEDSILPKLEFWEICQNYIIVKPEYKNKRYRNSGILSLPFKLCKLILSTANQTEEQDFLAEVNCKHPNNTIGLVSVCIKPGSIELKNYAPIKCTITVICRIEVMHYGGEHTKSHLVTMEYPWVAQETQNNKRNTEVATKIVKPHTRKNIPVVVNLDNFTAEDIGALDAELSNNFPCWRRDHGLVSVDVENFPVYKNTGTRTDVSLNLAIGHGVKLRPEDDAIRTGIVDETIALVSIDLLPTRQLCFRFIISYYKNNHSKAKSLHHMEYMVDLEPETSDVRITSSTVNDNGKLILTTSEREQINTEVVVETPLTDEDIWLKLVSVLLWYCAQPTDLNVYMNSLKAAFNITPTIKTVFYCHVSKIPDDVSVAIELFAKWRDKFPLLTALFYMLEIRRLNGKEQYGIFPDLEFTFTLDRMRASFTEIKRIS